MKEPLMSNEKTNSWIFLAAGMSSNGLPITYKDVLLIADGINHAVPMHKELQCAFRWLLGHKLLRKEGRKYSITDKGIALLKQASAKSNLILRQWDYIEEQFHILSSQDNDTKP
jgi:hypothetical protein